MKKENHQWENAYRKVLIEALHPFGDVLQVGFNREAAEQIQLFHPSHHAIIEHDPNSAVEARIWAKQHSGVQIIEEHWQSAMPQLGIFDAIFFDEKPVLQTGAGKEFLQRGNQLLEEIETQFPQLAAMRYSEADLDAFCHSAVHSSKNHLSQFLLELEEKGQISPELREKMSRKYKLKVARPKKVSAVFRTYLDLTFFFLKDCLKNHMRKGSRFSSFSRDSASKSDDHLFFEHIITNPVVDYMEKLVSIKIPETKKGKKGLVLVLEKLA